jgi:hypothetical protein
MIESLITKSVINHQSSITSQGITPQPPVATSRHRSNQVSVICRVTSVISDPLSVIANMIVCVLHVLESGYSMYHSLGALRTPPSASVE